jgi:hypothetical protein
LSPLVSISNEPELKTLRESVEGLVGLFETNTPHALLPGPEVDAWIEYSEPNEYPPLDPFETDSAALSTAE